MKRMFKRVLPIVLLAVCLLLSGCAKQMSESNETMRQIVQAFNDGDADAVYRMFPPNSIDEKAFDAFFSETLEGWQKVDPQEVRAIGFNINTKGGASTTQMTFLLPGDMENNVMQFEIESTKEHGTYLSSLNFGTLPEDYNTSGGTLQKISTPVLIWDLVCFVFLIFTIVDIVRKKPKGYGWFIALAVLLSIPVTIGGAACSVPVGVILWWCLRKVLMKKKNAIAAENAKAQEIEQAERMARLAAMQAAANAAEPAPEETAEAPAEEAAPVDAQEEP